MQIRTWASKAVVATLLGLSCAGCPTDGTDQPTFDLYVVNATRDKTIDEVILRNQILEDAEVIHNEVIEPFSMVRLKVPVDTFGADSGQVDIEIAGFGPAASSDGPLGPDPVVVLLTPSPTCEGINFDVADFEAL